jgi:hypothetical protein
MAMRSKIGTMQLKSVSFNFRFGLIFRIYCVSVLAYQHMVDASLQTSVSLLGAAPGTVGKVRVDADSDHLDVACGVIFRRTFVCSKTTSRLNLDFILGNGILHLNLIQNFINYVLNSKMS